MIAYFYNPLTLAMYNSAKGIADFFRNFVQAANMIVYQEHQTFFPKVIWKELEQFIIKESSIH